MQVFGLIRTATSRFAVAPFSFFDLLLAFSSLFYFSSCPSPSLSSSDWYQLMSEPAYGFVLFDYITGNVEAQTDRSQLL